MTTTTTQAGQARDVFFEREGVRLHGIDWGGSTDGVPVIMLHGVGGNGWTWDAVATRLRATLGDGYHLVGLDQRGSGDSDKPASGYEPDEFARDVLAVQDALGGKPMVLVGHSRGGWLAAFVAAHWPERVSHLVLIDPARLSFDSAQDADDFYGPVKALLGPFASREEALAAARQRDPRAQWTPARQRTFLFGLEERSDGSLAGKTPPWVIDQLRAVRETEDRVSPSLHRASMPTLLLVASTSPEKRLNQKLAYKQRIPHARLEMLDGTHNLQNDLPDQVAALMTDFLRGATGSSAP
jgi:pimeloyl-ACP methyl ester carboxylesterase